MPKKLYTYNNIKSLLQRENISQIWRFVVDWNQRLLRDNFLTPNRIVKISNAKCYEVRWPDQYIVKSEVGCVEQNESRNIRGKIYTVEIQVATDRRRSSRSSKPFSTTLPRSKAIDGHSSSLSVPSSSESPSIRRGNSENSIFSRLL